MNKFFFTLFEDVRDEKIAAPMFMSELAFLMDIYKISNDKQFLSYIERMGDKKSAHEFAKMISQEWEHWSITKENELVSPIGETSNALRNA